jgi:predicted dehydrogenase
MVRIGLCDGDTSHVVEFTKRYNHIEVGEDQWIEGCKVVAMYPGTSEICEAALIQKYAEQLRAWGVEIVDRPEDLIGKVDAVQIESNEGGKHRRHAEMFLNAGLPCFVDKPFTCSVEDAKAIAALAEKKGIAVLSASSLRYALEIQALRADEENMGKVVGADAYSPAGLHGRNPGLFHYGIHAVETLYALMGPGCEQVWCSFAPGAEVVVGRWKDLRIGTVRGTRAGAHSYGYTAFCQKGVLPTTIDAGFIYRELLKRISEMFQTGKAPFDVRQSVEIVAFIEAAMKSAQLDGAPVELDR